MEGRVEKEGRGREKRGGPLTKCWLYQCMLKYIPKSAGDMTGCERQVYIGLLLQLETTVCCHICKHDKIAYSVLIEIALKWFQL